MSDKTLYAVGGITIDDVVLSSCGQAWMAQPGGNVMYSALGARIWWDKVAVLARVGNDYPVGTLKNIENLGIRLRLQVIDIPSVHLWALYEGDGKRQWVRHLESSTHEAVDLDPSRIQPEDLEGTAYHIAPMPTDKQAAMVAKLKSSGCLVSLDPYEPQIVDHRQELLALLADVDIFLPSEIEARLLYGADDPDKAVREFAEHGPGVVGIKLGSEGSLVYDKTHDRLARVPIYPAEVRDPTGAGDAYCGGFLAGYLLTNDPIAAGLYGTVSASYIIEAFGVLAAQMPTIEERSGRLSVVRERMRSRAD